MVDAVVGKVGTGMESVPAVAGQRCGGGGGIMGGGGDGGRVRD